MLQETQKLSAVSKGQVGIHYLWYLFQIDLFTASRVPFEIRFLSDNFEFQAQEGMVTPNGFRLGYTQVAC